MVAEAFARKPVSVILGAGASRAVNYGAPRFPSPLDRDFFELLQRLRINYKSGFLKNNVEKAKDFVVLQGLNFEHGRFVHSMEELFYRLHQKVILHYLLFPREFRTPDPDDDLRKKFTIVIQALLRAAHGTLTCGHHVRLFRPLGGGDAILTFNYDLVAERALRRLHAHKREFGLWLYGAGDESQALPTIHKLHGSVNWEEGKQIKARQERWSDFDDAPGATGFNILLPYWEKRVWRPPWKDIWHRAAQQLRSTARLIVWGYSLPVTDLKARELIRVGLRPDSKSTVLEEVCVIDLNPETRQRWRQIFLEQSFWGYQNIDEFFRDPPPWYRLSK